MGLSSNSAILEASSLCARGPTTMPRALRRDAVQRVDNIAANGDLAKVT